MREELRKSKSKNYCRPQKKFQAGTFYIFPMKVMLLRIWLAPKVICIFAPKLKIVSIEENDRIIVAIESNAYVAY